MLRDLSDLPLRRPGLVLGLALAALAAALPGLTRLTMRTDGNTLVPRGARELVTDREVRARFRVEDLMLVVVDTGAPDGIFDPATLRILQELTREIGRLPGIRRGGLVSLATEFGDRRVDGRTEYRALLDPLPATPAELDRLRGDLDAYRIYDGLLVSHTRSAAAILIYVLPETDRIGLYHRILELAREQSVSTQRIDLVGSPVAETLLGTHILEDLAVLVPFAIALMAVIFFLGFRRLSAVLLPLTEVGACLVFTLGVMGWAGVPIYLTTSVLPVVLTAVGVADEIHIFSAVRRRSWSRPADRRTAVAEAMAEVRAPVVRTSLTTAVAFGSFAASPLASVAAFGLFAALGVLFCLGWSLWVTPAVLALWGPRQNAGLDASSHRLSRLLGRLAAGTLRRRRAILAAGAAILMLALAGASRIVVQDSWIESFSPASGLRRATERTNRSFMGTHLLYLDVESDGRSWRGEVAPEAIEPRRLVVEADGLPAPGELAGQWLELGAADLLAEPGASPTARAGAASSASAAARNPFRRPVAGRIAAASLAGGRLELLFDDTAPSLTGALRSRPGRGDGLLHFRIAPRALLRPEILQPVCRLVEAVRNSGNASVGGALGPCDHLETMSFIARGREEAFRRVPDEPRWVRWVWERYAATRGLHRRAEVIDDLQAGTLITVFLEQANYAATRELIEDVRSFERTELAPLGLHVRLAGDVAVSQTLISAVVRTQVRSLALSLVGILLVAWAFTRSLATGLLILLPTSAALLVQFAGMGLVGIPLGVATSMFAAMVLGVGVDYAIHLFESLRRRQADGEPMAAALVGAVETTGPAIVIDGCAIALGFGVMVLSQVPPNARLGGFLALSVATCMLATLVLLPALLATRGRRRAAGATHPPVAP